MEALLVGLGIWVLKPVQVALQQERPMQPKSWAARHGAV